MARHHDRPARVGGHVHAIRRNLVESRVLLIVNLFLVGGTGALLAQLVHADLEATAITAGAFLAGGALAFVISVGGIAGRIDARTPGAAFDRVDRLLAGVSIAAGIRPPALRVIHSPAPNALAFGIRPNRATVAVTTGLLEILTLDEVEAVLAHEVAHIANRDTSVLTVGYGAFAFLNFLATACALVAASAIAIGSAVGDTDEDGGWAVVAGAVVLGALFLLLLVAPSVAATWLVTMAISRNREALADATAVGYLGTPVPLRTALEKLAGAPNPDLPRGIAAMCIHAGGKHRSSGSTHPPLAWRIDVLRALEGLPPARYPAYDDAVHRNPPWGIAIPMVGLILIAGLVALRIDARLVDRPSDAALPASHCDADAIVPATTTVDPVLDHATLTNGICFVGADGDEYSVTRFAPPGAVRMVLLRWDPDEPHPSGWPAGAWEVALADVDWERVGQHTRLEPPRLRQLARRLARDA